MLKGVFAAIPTPFDLEGRLDEKALRNHIRFLIEGGIDGIVPCGTTGESATLSYEEHERVIEIAIEEASGKVKVIAGTGSNSTAEALKLTEFAYKAGADAALLITPYYNKPNQEGLYRHFKTIADRVPIPIVLYNVPSRTGVNLLPETVAKLAQVDNIVAIKEATGSTNVATKIKILCQDRITVLSGDDKTFFPLLSVGAEGVISVTANIAPKQMKKMFELFMQGKVFEAMQIHSFLFPVHEVMFIDTNPIPVKTALSFMGMMEKSFRLPLCPTTPENEEKIKQVLKDRGIL